MDNKVFERNTGMALQLSRYYYNYHISRQIPQGESFGHVTIGKTYELELEDVAGLILCKWPGRSHILKRSIEEDLDIKYFLDGAHTKVSMQFCAQWFINASKSEIR